MSGQISLEESERILNMAAGFYAKNNSLEWNRSIQITATIKDISVSRALIKVNPSLLNGGSNPIELVSRCFKLSSLYDRRVEAAREEAIEELRTRLHEWHDLAERVGGKLLVKQLIEEVSGG